jgi:hypothetical protein
MENLTEELRQHLDEMVVVEMREAGKWWLERFWEPKTRLLAYFVVFERISHSRQEDGASTSPSPSTLLTWSWTKTEIPNHLNMYSVVEKAMLQCAAVRVRHEQRPSYDRGLSMFK